MAPARPRLFAIAIGADFGSRRQNPQSFRRVGPLFYLALCRPIPKFFISCSFIWSLWSSIPSLGDIPWGRINSSWSSPNRVSYSKRCIWQRCPRHCRNLDRLVNPRRAKPSNDHTLANATYASPGIRRAPLPIFIQRLTRNSNVNSFDMAILIPHRRISVVAIRDAFFYAIPIA